MKHAKKLLALLLALAVVFALAVPAYAAGEGGFVGWIKTVWEKIKTAVRDFLVWLKILDPPEPPPPPCDPDDPDDPDHRIVRKPVIYLYPERPMEVGVTLQTRGAHLAESIPAYGDGWRVLARPDGVLTDLAGGGEYPYLFWEAELETPWPGLTQGFIVAREDLDGFLREKLAFMGLNDKEAAEFIAYWLPALAKNEFTLIQFAGEEYTQRFPLEITPAPDSLLRVFMAARAARGDEHVMPQALAPFERRGFAAVEWGGIIVSL